MCHTKDNDSSEVFDNSHNFIQSLGWNPLRRFAFFGFLWWNAVPKISDANDLTLRESLSLMSDTKKRFAHSNVNADAGEARCCLAGGSL